MPNPPAGPVAPALFRQSSRASQRRRERANSPWTRWALIVLGCLLCALCFNVLLRPLAIAPGGVVGTSVILNRLWGWEPALTQWGLNWGILLLCGRALGRRTVADSAAAMLLIPLFVLASRSLPAPTTNPLLATLVGATGIGAGLGLIMRSGASVGGFSAVALALHRWRGWSIQAGLLLTDAGMLLLGAFVLTGEQWLSSLVAIYLVGRTARVVLTGWNRSLVATIISRKSAQIRPVVLEQLSLGLTVLPGRGGYRGEPAELLLVVLAPPELVGLKAAIRAVDPEAFVVVSDAGEVLGHGFAPHR